MTGMPSAHLYPRPGPRRWLTSASRGARAAARGARRRARRPLAGRGQRLHAPDAGVRDRVLLGRVWTRPGLDRRTRSLINLGMLTALGSGHELEVHVRGALTNGATETEIRETLLQAAVYCGVPAGIEAFRRADAVLASSAASAPARAERQPAPERSRVSEETIDNGRIRDEWVAAHGAWNDDWNDFLALDPGFFERYLQLAAHPWRHGALEPEGQGARAALGRRGRHPPLRPGRPPSPAPRPRARREPRRGHRDARADRDDGHPRLQRRRPDPARGARGSRAAARARAR